MSVRVDRKTFEIYDLLSEILYFTETRLSTFNLKRGDLIFSHFSWIFCGLVNSTFCTTCLSGRLGVMPG